MDLKQNIIDNILECEIKIGHDNLPITFYYPRESLVDLLGCQDTELNQAVEAFVKNVSDELGRVSVISQDNKDERFAVTVQPNGVEWVNQNFEASEFIRSFIAKIRMPGKTLTDMVEFFRSFNNEVIVEEESEDEWALYFKSEDVDPYVYYIESNVFGLEYHRFTHSAYQRLKEN